MFVVAPLAPKTTTHGYENNTDAVTIAFSTLVNLPGAAEMTNGMYCRTYLISTGSNNSEKQPFADLPKQPFETQPIFVIWKMESIKQN